jgi:hypothetical protein
LANDIAVLSCVDLIRERQEIDAGKARLQV